jgi:hypothetical protein
MGKILGEFSPKIEIFVIFRENIGEFSVIYGEKYFRHIWLCTCALRHIWGKISLTFLSVHKATLLRWSCVVARVTWYCSWSCSRDWLFLLIFPLAFHKYNAMYQQCMTIIEIRRCTRISVVHSFRLIQ